jgi:C-terminal processing protease CtpA/Prc
MSAYRENRGLTGPLPLCTPNITRLPNSIRYTKPVMMMIDEFSTSTADSVPAMFQDAGRGPLFGWRSNGAGGNNTTFSSGAKDSRA